MKPTWKKALCLGLGISLCGSATAATRSTPIPRSATQNFRTEGLFEGGTSPTANIEGLHLSEHSGAERWTLDFSEVAKREVGKVAPRFQVRYLPGDKIIGQSGELILAKPAKFILTFRGIRKNFLSRGTLQEMVKRSQYVKDIVVYPPIEEGDTAIELILRDNVSFEPHQPIQKEGRLVLDLKEVKL